MLEAARSAQDAFCAVARTRWLLDRLAWCGRCASAGQLGGVKPSFGRGLWRRRDEASKREEKQSVSGWNRCCLGWFRPLGSGLVCKQDKQTKQNLEKTQMKGENAKQGNPDVLHVSGTKQTDVLIGCWGWFSKAKLFAGHFDTVQDRQHQPAWVCMV